MVCFIGISFQRSILWTLGIFCRCLGLLLRGTSPFDYRPDVFFSFVCCMTSLMKVLIGPPQSLTSVVKSARNQIRKKKCCCVTSVKVKFGRQRSVMNFTAGYHTFCLRPKLANIPSGDWFCPVCQPTPRKRQNASRYQDGLTEGDEDSSGQPPRKVGRSRKSLVIAHCRVSHWWNSVGRTRHRSWWFLGRSPPTK